MQRCECVILTDEELEQALSNLCGGVNVYVGRNHESDNFYYAQASGHHIIPHEVDEYLAKFLNVKSCEHWTGDDGQVVVVIKEK